MRIIGLISLRTMLIHTTSLAEIATTGNLLPNAGTGRTNLQSSNSTVDGFNNTNGFTTNGVVQDYTSMFGEIEVGGSGSISTSGSLEGVSSTKEDGSSFTITTDSLDGGVTLNSRTEIQNCEWVGSNHQCGQASSGGGQKDSYSTTITIKDADNNTLSTVTQNRNTDAGYYNNTHTYTDTVIHNGTGARNWEWEWSAQDGGNTNSTQLIGPNLLGAELKAILSDITYSPLPPAVEEEIEEVFEDLITEFEQIEEIIEMEEEVQFEVIFFEEEVIEMQEEEQFEEPIMVISQEIIKEEEKEEEMPVIFETFTQLTEEEKEEEMPTVFETFEELITEEEEEEKEEVVQEEIMQEEKEEETEEITQEEAKEEETQTASNEEEETNEAPTKEEEKEETKTAKKEEKEENTKEEKKEEKEEKKLVKKEEKKEGKQVKTKDEKLELIMAKIDDEVKDISKNLQLKSLIKLKQMHNNEMIGAYNIPFYEPKNIYKDQINIFDNRDIYSNITLSSYYKSDPMNIQHRKIEKIKQEKKQLLIEIEALKNG